MQWAVLPLKRYSVFSGRSRRKEFWLFMLLMLIISMVARMIDRALGMSGMFGGLYGPVSLLAFLALLTPQFSVSVRRLHDTGRSGWWVLLGFLPAVTVALSMMTGIEVLNLLSLVALVLLYFFVLDGTRGPNQYGPDPKADSAAAAAPQAS
jgi:uncharacterized membrane protein YhaH (DUF805 family)